MTSAGAALAAAIEQLGTAGVPEPRPDAEVLLAHALGTSRTDVIARAREPLLQEVAARFERLVRSEEHTSELQSPYDLVCRLLREKKKKTLAYLMPVIRSGKRVIISTGTKNLQEQLFQKDIPSLEKALFPEGDRKLSVCRMQGRNE